VELITYLGEGGEDVKIASLDVTFVCSFA